MSLLLLICLATVGADDGPAYPPASFYLHDREFEEGYDKFHDELRLSVSLGEVFRGPDSRLRLDVTRVSPGVLRTRGGVNLHFIGNGSDGWRYLKFRRVVLMVDGERWTYDPEHHGDVMKGGVLEQLFVPLTEERFLKLAGAKSAEIKVAGDVIKLSYADLQAIRELASLIGDPSAPLPDRTPRPATKAAPKARRKKADFSAVDGAIGRMAEGVAAQQRAAQQFRARLAIEDTPRGITNNSPLTGMTGLGACGATRADGAPCRNTVQGGGYCQVHR